LRKALQKLGFTASYPTAPIKLALPDSADPEERAQLEGQGIDDESCGWWVKDEEKQEYIGLDKTWAYLAEYIKEEVTVSEFQFSTLVLIGVGAF
jgi:hypothetical protein